MAATSDPQGPLVNAPLWRVGTAESVEFWGRTYPPKIEPDSTDMPYIIEMQDRHDLLAYRLMGSSQLGWIIMERNYDISEGEIDMRLWPNDFVPGLQIKIPSRESLRNRGLSA